MTRSLQSEADNKDFRVIIGKVGAPHGLDGTLRIIPLTDFPDRFDGMQEVYVGDELLKIEKCRWHQDRLLMKFSKYPVREEAARLTGKMLSVPRNQAADLNDGEYYTFDIVGLSVYDTDENMIGEVTEVLRTGSNDVYAVKRENAPERLVPALKKVVREIDVDGGRMVIDMEAID